jgi:hypothetical protein
MKTPARLCLVALLLAAAAPAPAAEEQQPISPAERLLFAEQHLGGVKPPLSLRYDYRKSGSLESASEDAVVLQLSEASDGRCCNTKTGFASGQRLPQLEVADARANPVLMYFLEHDVREMQRLTRGQPNYFRKRIRMALAEHAQVSAITVRYRGRDVAARQVSVTPYADDPMRARYDRLADKQYFFVLADAVPGGIAQIRTLLPAAQAGETPVLQETLTLQEVTTP